MKKIVIEPYDKNWVTQFNSKAKQIKDLLGNNAMRIEHIGSTSIPNLDAKKNIDMLLVINKLQKSLLLQKLGYIFKGEINIPLRYFFSKNSGGTKVNLHVCENDHGFIPLNLAFRDWLRTNDHDKNEYQKLKHRILQDENSHKKILGNLPNYTLSKNKFIKEILSKTDFNELIVNFCTHEKEIEYANNLLLATNTKIDISLREQKNFVLYKGSLIIGYCQVELGINQTANLDKFIIDQYHHKNKYEKFFITFISKWLKFHGYQILTIDLNSENIEFYTKLGFEEMTNVNQTKLGKLT